MHLKCIDGSLRETRLIQIAIYLCFKDDEDADVIIKLTSTNPQELTNVVNFDFNQKEFAPPKMRLRDFS